MPGSLLMFLRELVVPAVGEIVEQLAVLELPLHRGAREVVHDGGELAEVAEQQELDFAVHGDAGDVVPQPRVQLCDLFRHQPVDVAVPVPDGAPRPVVGRLRLHAEVLHGGVGFGDDLDLVPFFPEGGHDLARQVGFPGARVARQQQASANSRQWSTGSSVTFQFTVLQQQFRQCGFCWLLLLCRNVKARTRNAPWDSSTTTHTCCRCPEAGALSKKAHVQALATGTRCPNAGGLR